ncbi:hypothetical protein EDD15DRAFT_2387937 [Pisolithus albus]|nr:hypothetical protein EDD15DRAFT_2387937 [Pisolithus albus]
MSHILFWMVGENPLTRLTFNPQDAWHPFTSEGHFELADFLFSREQMSGGNIDDLMHIWAALDGKGKPPFNSHSHLYQTIDDINQENTWDCLEMHHVEAKNPNAAPWKQTTYQICLRDAGKLVEKQLSNPDLKEFIDYSPHLLFGENHQRVWSNFMTGNWAWNQCNELAKKEENHGAMFVPIILGSDKTVVSVATGNNEYWPLYITTGNAVSLLGFLSVPKTDREFEADPDFRNFRRHLFHTSLAAALETIKPTISTPKVILCADGQYRHAIYGIGPYIADYPEQALLACIVQGWCPKCTAHRSNLDGDDNAILHNHDYTKLLMSKFTHQVLWKEYGVPFTAYFSRANIHELLSPDILHQVIKGTFKDHLVAWVEAYIRGHFPDPDAILADIDRRIAAVPSFPGLRRFPQGCGFKQWTGDDSKALMKVYLPAVADYLPDKMVQAISAFMDFCYIVRQSSLDEGNLAAMKTALSCFQAHRTIFEESGVHAKRISMPHIHALQHYHDMVQSFGAPNGLCSSITESKHIQAVKNPWRRTNQYEALYQMLVINQRLDNLGIFRAHMVAKGKWIFNMCHLSKPLVPQGIVPQMQMHPIEWNEPNARNDENIEEVRDMQGARVEATVHLAGVPSPQHLREFSDMGQDINHDEFPNLVAAFVYQQQHPGATLGTSISYPLILERGYTFDSAIATFHAPSDLSGIGGMQSQRIHATPSWRGGPPRYDCVFIEKDPSLPGFQGLLVAQVILIFSFSYRNMTYSCAVVRWFQTVGDNPCPKTGMWMVKPSFDDNGDHMVSVITLDNILRPAHLIGIYGPEPLPRDFTHTDSLTAFSAFYVNKFSDYHAYQLCF